MVTKLKHGFSNPYLFWSAKFMYFEPVIARQRYATFCVAQCSLSIRFVDAEACELCMPKHPVFGCRMPHSLNRTKGTIWSLCWMNAAAHMVC
jgi:hypothetical protein